MDREERIRQVILLAVGLAAGGGSAWCFALGGGPLFGLGLILALVAVLCVAAALWPRSWGLDGWDLWHAADLTDLLFFWWR